MAKIVASVVSAHRGGCCTNGLYLSRYSLCRYERGRRLHQLAATEGPEVQRDALHHLGRRRIAAAACPGDERLERATRRGNAIGAFFPLQYPLSQSSRPTITCTATPSRAPVARL